MANWKKDYTYPKELSKSLSVVFATIYEKEFLSCVLNGFKQLKKLQQILKKIQYEKLFPNVFRSHYIDCTDRAALRARFVCLR